MKDNLIPLRKTGPFVEPFVSLESLRQSAKKRARGEEGSEKAYAAERNEPPRALKSLAKIIDGDLCHRCGSCVGICPTSVLTTDDEEYPIVKNLSACTDCDLCVKVCPGDEFNAPSISNQLFGEFPDRTDIHGHFEESFLSYATEASIRRESTSGGLVTALLVSMLERGVIDGAVVIASDPEVKWKGMPIVARTKQEILDSTKSKYAITPTNVVLEEIRNVEGKYAVVGLPCQIHGIQKAARLDKRIKERIVTTIGLFCHAAIEHDPMRYIWNGLSDHVKENADKFISRYGKHSGTPHIQLKDGSVSPVYFPNAKGYRPSSMEIINLLYRMYSPARCLTCYDATSEFADIAVGDPWMAPPADDINFHEGYSFVFARTKSGLALVEECKDAGAIELVPLHRDVAKRCNTSMGEEKRWRAFRIIESRRRQGNPIPDYGFKTPSISGKQFLLTEMNMLTHSLCYMPRWRGYFLPVLFSKFGYAMLWLNNKRRRFRDWKRDRKDLIRRKFFEKEKYSVSAKRK